MIGRSLASQPGQIHGIDIRVEDHQVPVPHKDGKGGEDGFIPMGCRGCVHDPDREITEAQVLGPKHDAGHGHHHRAPHEGPVLHLLGVAEHAKGRTFGSQTQVEANHVVDVLGVLPGRQQLDQDDPIPARPGQMEEV